MYTVYRILQCILYIVYCILYTVYCILYTVYGILYTASPWQSPGQFDFTSQRWGCQADCWIHRITQETSGLCSTLHYKANRYDRSHSVQGLLQYCFCKQEWTFMLTEVFLSDIIQKGDCQKNLWLYKENIVNKRVFVCERKTWEKYMYITSNHLINSFTNGTFLNSKFEYRYLDRNIYIQAEI